MKFKIGDVVQLKSGGPEMTIDGISEDTVHCVWFNDKDEHKMNNFHIDSIELVTE